MADTDPDIAASDTAAAVTNSAVDNPGATILGEYGLKRELMTLSLILVARRGRYTAGIRRRDCGQGGGRDRVLR